MRWEGGRNGGGGRKREGRRAGRRERGTALWVVWSLESRFSVLDFVLKQTWKLWEGWKAWFNAVVNNTSLASFSLVDACPLLTLRPKHKPSKLLPCLSIAQPWEPQSGNRVTLRPKHKPSKLLPCLSIAQPWESQPGDGVTLRPKHQPSDHSNYCYCIYLSRFQEGHFLH